MSKKQGRGKRNPKSPNPKPERKMGKREKDKRRKRKTQRLFPYPQKETSLSLSVPSRFDRLWVYAYSSAPWRINPNKMTSRSPRIMSAPELKISTANDVPAILHDGPDGVPQSGHTRRYCPPRRVLLARAPAVRYPETPRNSGWPTVSGQPLRCFNVIESSYGILGASWM